MNKIIVQNPDIVFGQPTILGMRLTVFDVVYGIYINGIDDYMSDFDINLDQIKASLLYCINLECQVNPLGNFCSGCILHTLKNGKSYKKDELKEIIIDDCEYVISNNGESIYIGSMQEFEKDHFGRLGWMIAEEAFQKEYLKK